MNMLKGTWVLKAASLACAIATYSYIHNEISRQQAHRADPSYKLIKLTAKNLPLKVRLATSVPEGYRINESGVSTEPKQLTVIGPEALLEDADRAETALLDLSEHTKTVTRKVPLENVAGIHLAGVPYMVDVTVPIERIEPEPTPPAAEAS
jgi:YbbR domain-containing protein